MSAYPVGASNGGSTITVLLCLVGMVWWARQRRWTGLVLLSAPLVLNLIAAAAKRYPYGASCRLAQHLAPAVCIFAGLGLATLIDQLNSLPPQRIRWSLGLVGVFALIGIGGMIRDVLHPYRAPGCAWVREQMQQIRAQVGSDPVVVCGDPHGVDSVFTWYWLNEGNRVTWNYRLPSNLPASALVWGFYQGQQPDTGCRQLSEALYGSDPAWQLSKRLPYTYTPRDPKEPTEHCELFCFTRSAAAPATQAANTRPRRDG
jgi:hypothetical protein